jgi:hypothetical protein
MDQARMAYIVFKDFQSAFVGIIGFGGVAFTLWFNARQARIGRQAAILRQKDTSQIAIAEELRWIGLEMQHLLNLIASNPESLTFPPFGVVEVYPSQIGNIGVLSATQARAVIQTYAIVRSARSRIANLASTELNGSLRRGRGSFPAARMFLSQPHQYVLAAINVLEDETAKWIMPN